MVTRRPLWQHLGVWALALVSAVILVQSSLTFSPQDNPADQSLSPESSALVTPTPAPDETGPAETPAVNPPAPTPGGSTPAPTPDAPDPADSIDDNQIIADSSGATALGMLEEIEVKGKAPRTGYDREGQFGPAWQDIDHNGCDTRNDILARDLDQIVTEGFCRVLSGELIDPFSAQTISFLRGETTSREVQIDHVVSLANAWQTGAQGLGATAREQLANDPLNLIAVSGSLNAQKGDGDAATWLPPNRAFRCEYVARQIGVKHYYGLWVTQAERDQMIRVLETCPAFPALSPSEHADYRPGTIPPP